MTWFERSVLTPQRRARVRHDSAHLGIALALLALSACASDDMPADEALDDPAPPRAAQVTGCETGRSTLWWLLWWLQLPTECTSTPTAPVAAPTPTTESPVVTRTPEPAAPPVTRTPEPAAPPIVRRPEPADGSTGDLGFPALGTDLIDVTHYDLDFRWNPDEITLQARAAITLTTRAALTAIPLDFGEQLEVTDVRVSVDGGGATKVAVQHAREKLVAPLGATVPEGATVTVTVLYQGMPEPVLSTAPVAVGWTIHDNGAVGTLSEPDAAHQWFPANDHPIDKATFRTRITVPPDRVAVGNGVQEGAPVRNADGSVTWTWLMDAPMAPYLALVAIDEFSVLDQGSAAGVPLRNYVPRGQERTYESALAGQPAMLEFLVERLGPYPFREYGAVVAPGADIALETQGRSLFQGSTARDVGTVIHELAHHWMGNSVSLTRWQDDIWWIEGFARFSEWLWAEQTDGPNAYRDRALGAYRKLERQSHSSLRSPQIYHLFENDIYDGGALVFYQLRSALGDQAFFTALRTFCSRYRHQNATSEELFGVFNELAGRDVSGVVESWFSSGHVPVLTF